VLPLALGLCVFLAVYWGLIPARARRPAFAIVATSVLALYFPTSVAIVAVVALAARLIAGTESRPARRAAAVGFCLAALVVQKYGHHPLRVIGLSYAVFRLVHVFVEEGRAGERPGLGPLLEYVLFPPTYLSGPIARYSRFQLGAAVDGLGLDAAFWGTRRVLYGLAKKVYLAGPLRASAEAAFASTAPLSVAAAWSALFAYSLFIYLDFSAYCDLALGVGRLFGFSLPENFDWPYLAPSIAAFWRRWHMTLTEWLRDYVYLPVSALLTRRDALRRRPLAIGAVATMVTMFACGLWHGDTLSYALWGLGHGVLLTIHLVYRQRVVARIPARRRKALEASVAYTAFGTALTFLAVSLLWVLFRFPPAAAADYYGRLLGRAPMRPSASAFPTAAFNSGE
jgi:alginate O-acetyltransferase complex protein AlgI